MNTKNSKKIISTFAAIIVISMLAAMSVGHVAANGNVTVQVGLILDGSGSINATEWTTITEGVASAVENSSCLPHDGTVELTVVQFSDTAQVEVTPTAITSVTVAAAVATTIRNITQMKGMTCIACGFHVAADAMVNSTNFSVSAKQVLNLATDGDPNVCDPFFPSMDPYENAVQARNYTIATLDMTAPPDEINAEAIGSGVTWLLNSIVWPQPGSIATDPPYPTPGWVKEVADAEEFAESMCEKFGQIVPDDWAEINKELDDLIGNVSNATMPDIIKQRLVDKLVYAKELKDNAHEECLAGNFDGATKKLGVAENQVESFASMVEITRRITPEDKASFLADATEIIGKIDRLIEHIETTDSC